MWTTQFPKTPRQPTFPTSSGFEVVHESWLCQREFPKLELLFLKRAELPTRPDLIRHGGGGGHARLQNIRKAVYTNMVGWPFSVYPKFLSCPQLSLVYQTIVAGIASAR